MSKLETSNAVAPESLFTVPHIPAAGLRSVYADGSTLTPNSDGNHALIRFAFTRTETDTISETFPFEMRGQMVSQIGPTNFTTLQRKVVEALVLMTPDKALNLSQAILKILEQLPEEIKERYKIPGGELIQSARDEDPK